MPERLSSILGGLPFMMLLVDESGRRYIQLNKARIFEAVLISCITGVIAGGLSGYISIGKMEVKLSSIEKKVDTLDTRLWEHSMEKRK